MFIYIKLFIYTHRCNKLQIRTRKFQKMFLPEIDTDFLDNLLKILFLFVAYAYI